MLCIRSLLRFKKVTFVFLSLLTPSIAFASWVKLSPKELVEQTQVAVIGEFLGTTRIATSMKGKSLVVGIIKVKDDLGISVQYDFLLIAIRYVSAPLISTNIDFKKGQKGLWLLKQHSPDNALLYSASHPQQFVPFSDVSTMNHLKDLWMNKNRD
jgi:hypothetical protein